MTDGRAAAGRARRQAQARVGQRNAQDAPPPPGRRRWSALDVFTHFVVPFLILWALRRPVRERLAAGIGGYAPDTDVFTALVGLLDDRIYWLGHRGISHTLLGAPLYALGLAAVLSIPYWGRRWPRLQALRFTPAMLLIAVLASYTHLALDYTTMWGVAFVFPWSPQRFAIDLYFYSSLWIAAISLWFCWNLWKGRATDRFVRLWGTVILVALLASGGARLAWKPDAPEGGRSIPTGNEWAWATIAPTPTGYAMQSWSFGKPGEAAHIERIVPDDPDARAALDAARGSPLAKGFTLYAGGPLVEQVERREDGAWNVTLLDAMREAQRIGRPSWFPGGEDFGRLKLVVDEQGARERD